MDWIKITLGEVVGISVSTVLVYFLMLLFVKLNGLRSFSKMSAHDFAVTIAIGSILASVVVQKEPTLMQGVVAIGVFLIIQSLFSGWRMLRPESILENKPILLMDGPEILHKNLLIAKITKEDLKAKLREANVLRYSEVKAVVFEATGDVSVLHGDKEIDKDLLDSIRK
ncbi:MAG: hypothetical protein CL565_04410 [Alphaproteobacteria bacterium]|nr:hypothetical protein [Alphaproteobacteria bacterium]|tara:strand:+ start:1036 stop:1542 length:507 start_codon:yes stop_codon:yes gene_type:complete